MSGMAAQPPKRARAELNPAFRWEGGGKETAEPAQPAWSFGFAAQEVAEEHQLRNTTSLQTKLANVIAGRVRAPAPPTVTRYDPAAFSLTLCHPSPPPGSLAPGGCANEKVSRLVQPREA